MRFFHFQNQFEMKKVIEAMCTNTLSYSLRKPFIPSVF